MTTGVNTWANISSFVNTIYEDSLLVARDSTLAPSIVTVQSDMNSMAARVISQYGTATFNQVADTDDLTSQVFSPSAIGTLTPYEYGAQFFITDQRKDSDPFGAQQDATMELGEAYAESVDTNVFGLFNSFTGGTVGASGSAMTWAYFFDAVATIRNGKVPMNNLVAVLSPYQWNALATAASVAGSSTNAPEWLSGEVARNFFVARAAGVNIFVSALLETSSTDVYGAVYNPMAIALDIRRGYRLEPERDASRRGMELNATGIYAYGLRRPLWGVQLYTQNTV